MVVIFTDLLYKPEKLAIYDPVFSIEFSEAFTILSASSPKARNTSSHNLSV
jgi:hypothetical protein